MVSAEKKRYFCRKRLWDVLNGENMLRAGLLLLEPPALPEPFLSEEREVGNIYEVIGR